MIAIIDDDEPVRISTARLLESGGYRARPFASGEAFLLEQGPERIKCALLDMHMPGLSGLDVLRALCERDDAPAVLMVTGHGDIPLAVQAMRLGAVDFLEKPYPPDALLQAIRRASTTPQRAGAARPVDRQALAKVACLSERQRDVLDGILHGKPNKIIAWELGLSIRTVEAYRAQMLIKMGVRGTAEAVRVAMAAGMAGD